VTQSRAGLAGFAMACAGGLSGIATLMASPHLGGTYARVLVGVIALAAAIVAIAAMAGRRRRARNTAGLMLWLIAGAAFAHATEPSTGIGTALAGIAVLAPAAFFAIVTIVAADVGRGAGRPVPALTDRP